MRSRAKLTGCLLLLAAVVFSATAGNADELAGGTLRVCADPNNLPFSNEAEQGFENKIASLLAEEIGARLQYTWWPQRRGFVRNTLEARTCDVIVGVPVDYELVETTSPYYRSTYVFVWREDERLELESLLDERLRHLTIGVHLTGDDGTNPPPVHALGMRGIVDNVVGYMIYGDYREPDPPARLIEALAAGDIDIAAVWGPTGGFFAGRSTPPLVVRPIVDTDAFGRLPFEFSIAMGVRRGDTQTKQLLETAIAKRSDDITAVLRAYGVPLVTADSGEIEVASLEEAAP